MLFAVSCNHVSRSHSSHSSIVILYDNDVHCAIEGYAKMAGLRDSIADTAYVAMVSSGDYLQGSTVGAISTGGFIADIMVQSKINDARRRIAEAAGRVESIVRELKRSI